LEVLLCDFNNNARPFLVVLCTRNIKKFKDDGYFPPPSRLLKSPPIPVLFVAFPAI
jgi:hypothetical protein